MASRTITFVTGNKNKLKEVTQVLANNSKISFTNNPLDLPEFQGTPEEVATQKCLEATKHIKGPIMVEDTSLIFNGLNGMPGVYIKWFLKAVGTEGLHKMLQGFDDKTGYAQCIFAYTEGYQENQEAANPEASGDAEDQPSAAKIPKLTQPKVHLFRGVCDGQIVFPRGQTSFGWDPIFQPDAQPAGGQETFAEMSAEHKNQISHRSKALKLLQQHFE